MHIEALTYITRKAHEVHGSRAPIDVVEIGSLDVNGGLRHLYSKARRWIGVDIEDGPGVDVVADARDWRPNETFDLVICAEVFEHCDGYSRIIQTARMLCRPDAAFICTAACPPRAPHGAYDPDGTHGFRTDEFYRNVSPASLLHLLREQFTWVDVTVDGRRGDVYACARP